MKENLNRTPLYILAYQNPVSMWETPPLLVIKRQKRQEAAKIFGYKNEKELKEGDKCWHKCSDSGIIPFIEFEFKGL